MRDPQFRVGKADPADAIHASKADLPKIFKVMFSQIGSAPSVMSGSDTLGSTGSAGSPSAASDGSVESQYALLMADSQEVSVSLNLNKTQSCDSRKPANG